jgi:transposase
MEAAMEAIIERCCGLDVHQETVVACLLIGRADQKPRKEVRTFRTVTRELLALRDWLAAEACTHVAMESTGIYWRPVYAMLEGAVELVVGNAHHMKAVPGRKTDVKDSEWIAELLRHGLIAKSFVPPKALRDLRDLLRYRRKLVESRTAERNRLLKLLETANIKLASVMSDVFGVSGMLMLHALVRGDGDVDELAQLAKGRLRAKVDDLALALDGRVDDHHRFLLGIQLRRLEHVEADLTLLEQRIDERLAAHEKILTQLSTIPGVDRRVAAVIVAELGVDMRVFGSPRHVVAWAGVCAGNDESAGKRHRSRVRKGNVHLKTALVEAAQSAARTKGTYLRDKFFRLRARRGPQRAAMAIARKILIAAYHMLRTGSDYRDLGAAYLDQLSEKRVATNLVRRLERLGYTVRIERTAA